MPATILESAIGDLGFAWSPRGITRIFLPSLRLEREVRRDHDVLVDRPNGALGAAIDRVLQHVDGRDVDLDEVPLDLDAVTPFQRAVYRSARTIPRATTVSYAELAKKVGVRSPRAVGVALGKNPVPIVVPCHRVVGTHDCGGFSAPGGNTTKATLLAVEGGTLGDSEHAMARRHLARVDAKLAKIVRRAGCMLPVKPRGLLFRTIVRAIAGQQLSTKAAATIFGRLERAMGVLPVDAKGEPPGFSSAVPIEPVGPLQKWDDVEAPRRILALSHARLRSVGLSNAKALSLHDLARKVDDGVIDLARLPRMPDERVIETLVRVRGIGRWTVEMLLIFELGRPDVLPVDDLGIRKGFQRAMGTKSLPSASTIERRAEAWRPWRSIGSWYLWRALDAR